MQRGQLEQLSNGPARNMTRVPFHVMIGRFFVEVDSYLPFAAALGVKVGRMSRIGTPEP